MYTTFISFHNFLSSVWFHNFIFKFFQKAKKSSSPLNVSSWHISLASLYHRVKFWRKKNHNLFNKASLVLWFTPFQQPGWKYMPCLFQYTPVAATNLRCPLPYTWNCTHYYQLRRVYAKFQGNTSYNFLRVLDSNTLNMSMRPKCFS